MKGTTGKMNSLKASRERTKKSCGKRKHEAGYQTLISWIQGHRTAWPKGYKFGLALVEAGKAAGGLCACTCLLPSSIPFERLHWWSSGQEPAFQRKGCRFHPWSGNEVPHVPRSSQTWTVIFEPTQMVEESGSGCGDVSGTLCRSSTGNSNEGYKWTWR